MQHEDHQLTMALKYAVDTLDDLPTALHELYTAKEDGTGFRLLVEGVAPKEKVDEFRAGNIELRRQIEEYKTKYEGIDPEKYRDLTEKEQKQRDKRLIDAGKMDELLNERTGAMKAEYEKALTTERTNAGKLATQLSTLLIDNELMTAASKAGVRPAAMKYVMLMGREMFRLEDGKAVAKEGDRLVFGKDGEPLRISEWVPSLASVDPDLFTPSQGSGAPRGTAPANGRQGVISRDNSAEFLRNLEKIASGEVKAA